MSAGKKLAALRAALRAQKVDGFLLPVADEFLGEYVPPSAQRLAWLTGFTGSAGLAVVLRDKAALFTDGRYTLQAAQEADAKLYAQFNTADMRPEAWVAEHLPKGAKLGFDPFLHSRQEVQRLERAGIALKALSPNPVDALWVGRPARPASRVEPYPVKYAGEAQEKKRARVGAAIRKAGADVAVLAAADSVDWLLNIRGRDVEYSPLAQAYALVEASGKARLYVDAKRMAAKLPGVEARDPGRLQEDLAALGKKRVLVDAGLTPAWFVTELERSGAEIVYGDDPCQHMKAVKNTVELAGMRRAHVRDGLALSKFLCWLDAQESLTEMDAAAALLKFRQAAPEFVSPSFATIAGAGANGAIVHYRASKASNRRLRRGELFLLDSGGQYPDGTTDVTRTIAVGKPTAEQRRNFTLVLKGHIALALARFPEGTNGSQLDALARAALWAEGLDYDHGTGHGVGCFLNVHEGPQRIGKRGGGTALEAGMIVSNEPGYYKAGAYGIRIENLVEVVRLGAMENGKAMLGFETITCAPMDVRLVEAKLLSAAEKKWLNAYHAWVRETLAPGMGARELAWLKNATKAVS